MNDDRPQTFGDNYDRALGQLDGLPDVVHTRPFTLNLTTTLIGLAQTFIVQTFRQREQGDTVFLIAVSAEGSLRIVLPPRVTEAIARQRDALTGKSRSKAATALAQERKDRGEVPGFLRPGAKKPARGKRKAKRKAKGKAKGRLDAQLAGATYTGTGDPLRTAGPPAGGRRTRK